MENSGIRPGRKFRGKDSRDSPGVYALKLDHFQRSNLVFNRSILMSLHKESIQNTFPACDHTSLVGASLVAHTEERTWWLFSESLYC